MAADAISASRPGGRRESLERYIQRLEQLEDIAKESNQRCEGGVRDPGRSRDPCHRRFAKRVDDATAASKIARDIAKNVSRKQMTYPGEIKRNGSAGGPCDVSHAR